MWVYFGGGREAVQVNRKGFRECTEGPHRSASGTGLLWHQDSARGDSRLLPRSPYWGVLSATKRRVHPHLRVLRRLRSKPRRSRARAGALRRDVPPAARPGAGSQFGLQAPRRSAREPVRFASHNAGRMKF